MQRLGPPRPLGSSTVGTYESMLVGLLSSGAWGDSIRTPARMFPLRVHDSPIFRLCKFLDIRYSRIPNARQPNSQTLRRFDYSRQTF